MTAMRVLHILGTARPGGVETFVVNAVKVMGRDGYDFSACIVGAEGPVADELRVLGVDVTVLGTSGRLGVIAILRLAKLLLRGGFQVVHLHVGGRLLQFLVATLSAGAVIAHLHGPPVEPPDPFLSRKARTRRVRRVLAARPDRVLTCDPDIASEVSRACPELEGKVDVVPCGVDTERFRACSRDSQRASEARDSLGLSPSDFVLMFVGRLVPQKGIAQLARMFGRVSGRLPSVKLVVIGDGPLRSELETFLPGGSVVLMGERTDVERWLPACDALVLTSAWEAFGIVSLEAMASARPVIAFGVDGVPRVVVDGECGQLVPPGDVEAFARAVVALAGDRALCARMGAAARLRVEQHFSADRVAVQLEGLYALTMTRHSSKKSAAT